MEHRLSKAAGFPPGPFLLRATETELTAHLLGEAVSFHSARAVPSPWADSSLSQLLCKSVSKKSFLGAQILILIFYGLFPESVCACEDSLETQGQVWAPEGKADLWKPYRLFKFWKQRPSTGAPSGTPVTLADESLHTPFLGNREWNGARLGIRAALGASPSPGT